MRFHIPDGPEKTYDVLGFGTNAVDYLIRVPSYPDFNSKTELIDYKLAAGGEVATTIEGLQRLGLRTAYSGRFGRDDAGNFGIRSLVEAGVDMRFAETVEGAATQIAFIIIDESNGERTVIWQRDRRLAYDAADAPVEAVSLARALHLTPHDTAASIALARAAKAAGTVVSIDIDNDFDELDDLLVNVDILIASSDLPEKLLNQNDPQALVRYLADRYGCAIAGVTLGSSGSLLLCDGELIRTDGYEVPGACMDTTGAGDAFRAGLLYGLLTGETVEESARMANAVAALKCRAVGARTALPTSTELTEFLKKV